MTWTLDWPLVLDFKVQRHSSTILKLSDGLQLWNQKMTKARKQKHIILCTIVQSKTLTNLIHSKKSIKTLMKLWQVMELLLNVLIGITLSWLLDQEIYKILNYFFWFVIQIYLNSRALNNGKKIGRIILLSGQLY